MDIQPIKSKADYESALLETEKLWDAKKGTPEGDKLDILIMLIEAWEDAHDPIGFPDPVEAIKFHMEQTGMTRKDLESYIGPKQRVSDVLNRKRPLSLKMTRNLSTGLSIPVDVLIQESILAK
jgi:HTH-type transcriptional regulator/antitoxin HigA